MLNILRRKLHSARIRWHRARMLGMNWHGGRYREVFEQKHLLTGLLRGSDIATVSDLAVLRPGSALVLTNVIAAPPNEDPIALLDALPDGRYFVKPVVGEHGRKAGSLEKVNAGFELDGKPIEARQIVALQAAGSPGLLLQTWQAQHPEMAALNPDTLNTLRILSLQRRNGAVGVMHAVVRIGRAGAWLDNFHAGGIAMKVDLETGRTAAPAVRLDRSTTYTRHPDSGLALNDRPIPAFARCLALVDRAHALFPGLRTVGWDVAIAPEGPRIVEANLDWDAEIHAFADSGFRSMIDVELRSR